MKPETKKLLKEMALSIWTRYSLTSRWAGDNDCRG
jgi:hypothetical protein